MEDSGLNLEGQAWLGYANMEKDVLVFMVAGDVPAPWALNKTTGLEIDFQFASF